MATSEVTYSFNTSINRSVQIGDTLYYADAESTNNPVDTVSSYDAIKKAGTITAVNRTSSGGTIVIDQDVLVALPSDGDFIFFSKEASANNSHMLGYFAEIKFENDSKQSIELFNIATDVFESSK